MRHAAADVAVGAPDAEIDGIEQRRLEVLAGFRARAFFQFALAALQMGLRICVVDDDFIAFPDVEAAVADEFQRLVVFAFAVQEDDFTQQHVVAHVDDILAFLQEGQPRGGAFVLRFHHLVIFADENRIVRFEFNRLEEHFLRFVQPLRAVVFVAEAVVEVAELGTVLRGLFPAGERFVHALVVAHEATQQVVGLEVFRIGFQRRLQDLLRLPAEREAVVRRQAVRMFPCDFRVAFIAHPPLAVAAVVIDQRIERVQRFQLGESRLPLVGADGRRRILQRDIGGFAMSEAVVVPHACENVLQQRGGFLRGLFQHGGGFRLAVQRHQQFRQRQCRGRRLARIP